MAEGFSVLDLEKRIIQLCEKYPYGITEELLAIDMPDVLPLQRAAALHRLLSLRCIKKIKMTPPLLFRLKEADKPRKDTADSDDDGGQPGERHRKRKRIKEGKLSKKSLGLTAKQQLRVTSKATISTSDDSDSEQETKPKKRSSSDVPDKEARSQRIQSDSSSDAGQRKSRSPSKSGSGDVSSRGSSSSGSESEQNAKPKRRHISDSESHEVKRDTSSEHDKSHSDNEKQNSGSDDEKRNSGSSGSQSE